MEYFINMLLAVRLSIILRYMLATALIAGMTNIHLLLGGVLIDYPFLLYFPVIIVCGVVLDRGTSLYATLLCALLASFLFMEPRYQPPFSSTVGGVALSLFLATGLAISAIIEALHLAIERLAASRDETRVALEEKNLLLRELAHRVKNDFQAISFLLRIQSHQADNPAIKEALEEAADRINIMGYAHLRLVQQEFGERINVGDFLRDLAADFEATQIGSRLVRLDLDVAEVPVKQKQAVYLGLIVHELLTNALKYAFPSDRTGRITVSLKEEDDHIRLGVADDGVGPPPDVADAGGVGTGLVHSLAQALEGTLEVSTERGMSYTLRIPRGA